MTTEEKSRLLMLQARMLEDRAKENERLLAEIGSLKASIHESGENLAAVNKSLQALVSEMAELRKENREQKELIKVLRSENGALTEQLATSNKKTYGGKSLKGTSKKKQDKSREQDKDDFDGTAVTVSHSDINPPEGELLGHGL